MKIMQRKLKLVILLEDLLKRICGMGAYRLQCFGVE